MQEIPITLKRLIFCLSVSCLILFSSYRFSKSNSNTIMVFCSVGQGSAAYLRIDNYFDILVDAGPNQMILDCLGKYMPFYDKNIELVLISHPQRDHFGGLIPLLDYYSIDKIDIKNPNKNNELFLKTIAKLKEKKAERIALYQGDQINIGNTRLTILWPPHSYRFYDDNDQSQVMIFEKNGFRSMFTGDITPGVLDRLSHQNIGQLDILQIPHHGSKNGLTKNFLDLAKIRMAVISVGKNNAYGHPANSILDMIKAKNIIIKRTDEDGDIAFSITKEGYSLLP